MLAGEEHRTVQRDDGLPGSSRAADPRRSREVALHPLALGRMEEDGPLVPGVFQGALKLIQIAHEAEAPLGVRVGERIETGRRRRPRHLRLTPGRQLEQRLGRLGREMGDQFQQAILGGLAHVGKPFGRDAVAE